MIDRTDFVDALVQHWLTLHPREHPSKLAEFAKEFRIGQIAAVKRLFRHIRTAIQTHIDLDFPEPLDLQFFQPPTPLIHSYFAMLENLYAVLEDFCLPFPHKFQKIRFYLGFRCLPTEVFVQYLERDILYPDVRDIRNLIVRLAEAQVPHLPPFSIHGVLERALLQRISPKEQVSILAALPPSPEVDAAIFDSLRFSMPLRPNFVNYEVSNGSRLIPLSVWQASLRSIAAGPLSTKRSIPTPDFMFEVAAENVFGEPQTPKEQADEVVHVCAPALPPSQPASAVPDRFPPRSPVLSHFASTPNLIRRSKDTE